MPETSGRIDIHVIAIVGPTAVGKSAVAEKVSSCMNGEIVSADSMQIYRGMDIGTAKLPVDDRDVPYHCTDLADPGQDYSAALYQHDARTAIAEIHARGNRPFLVGGTGLYLRAALDDMQFPTGELAGPNRERLELLAEEIGAHALHARLDTLDPASAALIHPNNVRRTIRALEIAESGGSYADQAANFSQRTSAYNTTWIGLDIEREQLYKRIDDRVDVMIETGLLGEVERLLDQGFRKALTATQAIGYKEFVPVVENGADIGEAIQQVKQASRRYAKRQLTWFRGDPRLTWLDVTELSTEQAAEEVVRLIESAGEKGTCPGSNPPRRANGKD